MSSELRAKIANTIQECHRNGIAHYGEIAEHILALEGYIDRTPPATAKLPEGIKLVMCSACTAPWDVRTKNDTHYLDNEFKWQRLVGSRMFYGAWGTEALALTAALAAPPVPGESKPKTPAEVLKQNFVWGTIDGRVFACAHSGDCVAILNAVDAQRARIAELEADNTRLRAQYDMVEQERTRLMLGQQVPYTPAEKPDARNFVATGEQRQDDYYEKTITETKPDPLARAVTVGEMLRLAEDVERRGWPNVALAIRIVFTPPQGAEHAE